MQGNIIEHLTISTFVSLTPLNTGIKDWNSQSMQNGDLNYKAIRFFSQLLMNVYKLGYIHTTRRREMQSPGKIFCNYTDAIFSKETIQEILNAFAVDGEFT